MIGLPAQELLILDQLVLLTRQALILSYYFSQPDFGAPMICQLTLVARERASLAFKYRVRSCADAIRRMFFNHVASLPRDVRQKLHQKQASQFDPNQLCRIRTFSLRFGPFRAPALLSFEGAAIDMGPLKRQRRFGGDRVYRQAAQARSPNNFAVAKSRSHVKYLRRTVSQQGRRTASRRQAFSYRLNFYPSCRAESRKMSDTRRLSYIDAQKAQHLIDRLGRRRREKRSAKSGPRTSIIRPDICQARANGPNNFCVLVWLGGTTNRRDFGSRASLSARRFVAERRTRAKRHFRPACNS